jgi:hypothetical protein
MTPPPSPLPTHVRYVVTDKRDATKDPLSFHKTRPEAQAWIAERGDEDHHRVRRARIQIFNT